MRAGPGHIDVCGACVLAGGAEVAGAGDADLGCVDEDRPPAVRVALTGTAVGVACEGCPPLTDLLARYEAAGGRYYVCPICFNAKQLDAGGLIPGAELNGTVPMWKWIGDEPATTFSY